MLKLLASLALICSLSAPSQAQTIPGHPADSQLERFQMPMDDNGIINVEGGQVSSNTGDWGMHLWLGYSNDPLVVTADGKRVGALVSDRIGAAIGGYLVVLPKLAIGLELPVIIGQSSELNSLAGDSVETSGVGDVRLMSKYQLLSSGLNLAVGFNFTLPSSSDTAYFGDSDLTFAPYLAASKDIGSFEVAANAGYTIRPAPQVGNLRMNDELFGRLGLGYNVNEQHNLAVSVVTVPNARDFYSTDNRVYSEGMAAYTYRPEPGVSLMAGGGMGLNQGYGAPDWRGFLAIRFSSVPEVAKKTLTVKRPPAPPVAVPPEVKPERVVLHVPVVYFKFDKSDILPGYAAQLDHLAKDVAPLIERYPEANITVIAEGNTDAMGKDNYNFDLGLRRADAVANYLVNAGVPRANISVRTRGEANPVMGNKTETGRANNRRTEVRVNNVPNDSISIVNVTTRPDKEMMDGLGNRRKYK